jgi:hypothetical protein
MTRAVLVLCLMPCGALAAPVYLNGVSIDGLTNQRFEKCTVIIDEKGAVQLSCPGYSVQSQGAAKAGGPTASSTMGNDTSSAVDTPVPGRITKRYWLVTEQNMPGATQYDIDMFINSKWIRKLRSNEDQIITEITKYLEPGPNKILLAAHKNIVGARKSYSPEHKFQVTIGEGNVGGDQVMIDNPIVEFKRNASQTDDASQEYSLVAR